MFKGHEFGAFFFFFSRGTYRLIENLKSSVCTVYGRLTVYGQIRNEVGVEKVS